MDNGGLLEKTSSGPQVDADRSIIKIFILAVIGIAFSFFFGYFLKTFIIQGEWDFLLYSFLFALGFLTFFLLQVFFVKTSWIINLTILLETAGFLAPFYSSLSKSILIGALVAFLIFLSGAYIGRSELNNTLRIKFWRISKKALPKAIAGLALFSSIVYVGFNSPEIRGFLISPTAFEKIISPISRTGIVQKFIPGFDLSLPVETLIENFAVKQVQDNPQLSILPEAVRKELVEKSVDEFKKRISEFTGNPLDSGDKTSDVLYTIMTEKFGSLPENVKSFAPAIVAAIIFLTVIGLSLPIRIVATILAFLIYEIFLAFGLSAILMEGKSREIVVLK